jgi:hypothetical protein
MRHLLLPSRYRAWRGVMPFTCITAPPAPPPEEPVLGAIFVSTTGNDDTGNGSEGNPYYSLLKASKVVQPGDTIYMRHGYYDDVGNNVYLTGYSPSPSWKTLEIRGTQANPINIRSYPGEWAIFDGKNHPYHPRTYKDGDSLEPRLVRWIGEWVNWSHLEFRNSAGGGFRGHGMNSTFKHLVCANNNAQGFDLQGRFNEVAYCLFTDTLNRANAGNTGNGWLLARLSAGFTDTQSPQYQAYYNELFGGSRITEYNLVHHCVSRLNSDDGGSCGNTFRNIVEYCVSYQSGRDVDPHIAPQKYEGMGTGYKMGRDWTKDSGMVFRYNLAIDNRDWAYASNTSEGQLCHNNTAYLGSDHFALRAGDYGANTGHNNAAVAYTAWPRTVTSDTIHTHNVAVDMNNVRGWAGGEDNLRVSNGHFLSLDISHPDFACLGEQSPLRGHGIVIEKATDVDVGAVPYGQRFAGGWKWYQVLQSYPSVRQWPKPQTTPITIPNLDPA